MNTDKLIKELEKVHETQPTLPAAILLAIRARMESKSGLVNRIGKTFPNGNRGVLFVGKAGVGKTKIMSEIFDGLSLDRTNSNGQLIGKWLHSTGGSTGVGMYEVLEVYNDSIIFADELSLSTEKHLHVMKQIANGELIRPRHGNIESTPFSGLLIGATNAIKLPPNNIELEHLLATLDRFMIVQARATLKTAQETMQIALSNDEDSKPDWEMIAKALTRKNTEDLQEEEKALVRTIWQEKTREILDPTRAQWRNSHAVIDICLFCKRFFGIQDLTKDKKAIAFMKQMIDDCVLFNPVGLLWLNPLEQVIYDSIKKKDLVSTSEILSSVSAAGISVTRMTINRLMNKMQETSLIVRRAHGKYSTKQPSGAYTTVEDGQREADEMLQVQKPQAVIDLADNL